MLVPGKFPSGSKFFETDGGALFAKLSGEWFVVSGGNLLPSKAGAPLSEPTPISESSFLRKARAEAAESASR